ncbi:MAG: hypothetical protein JSV44_05590, partial [Candidatus Zixiibacteriota bacterium]
IKCHLQPYPDIGTVYPAGNFAGFDRKSEYLQYNVALLPIMFDHGTGWEVMQRIAASMAEGPVSSAILTPIVVPVLCHIIKAGRPVKLAE